MNIKIILSIFLCFSLLSSCKKTTEQLFDEAYSLTKKGKLDKAIKIYSDLIKQNDKLQSAYYNRGYCYYSEKEYSKALQDFETLINLQTLGGGKIIFSLNSDSPFASEEAKYQVPYFDAVYQRAQVYSFLDKNEESFQDFKYLVDNNYEEKSNCFFWLGSLVLNKGDTVRACDYLTKSKETANRKDVLEAVEKMINECCRKNNNR
ncbi:MAG: tetratricopeptide repeat protein [Ferruginibacter sp.]